MTYVPPDAVNMGWGGAPIDPTLVTPNNVAGANALARFLAPIEQGSPWGGPESFQKWASRVPTGGSTVQSFRTTGIPLLANMLGQRVIQSSGLSPAAQGIASSLLGGGTNFAAMARMGMGMGTSAAAAGLPVLGYGLENFVDPRDTRGLDIHDVGQGLAVGGSLLPLGLSIGTALGGPVGAGIGAGIAGLAGLGQASNWFGLTNPNYYTNKEFAADLINAGMSKKTAQHLAGPLLEQLARDNQLTPGKVPQQAKESLVSWVGQNLGQAGYTSPAQNMLLKAMGLTSPLDDTGQLTKDTLDLVKQYQTGYTRDIFPSVVTLNQLRDSIKGMSTQGMGPEYSALAQANQNIAAAQIDLMTKQLLQQAQTAPMQIAQDYAYAVSQGMQPSYSSQRNSSSGSQTIQDYLTQLGGSSGG